MPTPFNVPADASFNTRLYLGGTSSPAVFTTPLDRVGNIDFPGMAQDVVDVSNQTSPAHRKLATLLNPGDCTFVYYYQPGGTQDQTLLELNITAPPPLAAWQVEYNDGTIFSFLGYLSKFPVKADIGKALEVACTITIDGAITPTY
jgi:hypothetical protein